MNKSVVIIGASGHGKVVADIIKKSGDEVVGFLDDNPHLPKELFPYSSCHVPDSIHEYQTCHPSHSN